MMTDMEEPPAHFISRTKEQNEIKQMDVSQEEWLSEGVLTDDDLTHMDHDISNEDVTNTGLEDSTIHSISDSKSVSISQTNENTDTTVDKHMECGDNTDKKNSEIVSKMKATIDELDEFLIRNDGNAEDCDNADLSLDDVKFRKESGVEHSPQQCTEEDDGNDTDELLRMLGEDNPKAANKKKFVKHLRKVETDIASDENDSFEDDIFEGVTKITKFKIAKNAVITNVRKRKNDNRSSSDSENYTEKVDKSKTNTKTYVNKNSHNSSSKIGNKNDYTKSGQNSQQKIVYNSHKSKQIQSNGRIENKNSKSNIRTVQAPKTKKNVLEKHNDIKGNESYDDDINEAEFLEDDLFDLEDDVLNGIEQTNHEDTQKRISENKQVIRNPEVMDEDIPSDADTEDTDYSFYDELPSSDSDLEDAFTIDIRSERASDYIPLLGEQAEKLLLSERKRVAETVSSLKQSLAELTNKTKSQVAEIEAARQKLIQLDALLSRT